MGGQDGESSTGVLRQLLRARNKSKAEDGRVPQLPMVPELTPAQAASVAIGRTAETLYQLPVKNETVTLNGVSLAEIPELLPENALLMILQGKGEELGVIALCREAVAALIEMQTCARVTSRPVPKRKLTRGDALMCAEFANSLLIELAEELGSLEGFAGWGDFRYATFLEDSRPLELILEDKLFRSLKCSLEFGSDQTRKATIFLALPNMSSAGAGSQRPEEPPRQLTAPVEMAEAGPDQADPRDLSASVRNIPVHVVAILCRRKITLGELRGLKQGEVISLPRTTLADVKLELPTGQVLATGKLGEAHGYQAIRLHDPAASGTVAADPLPAAETIERGSGIAIDAALPVDLDAPNEFLPMPEIDLESGFSSETG